MAIVQMQKVALLTHLSKKEEMLQALQDEGVLQVTESDQPSRIDHTEVEFREAEVQFAIDVLKGVAAKEVHAAAAKPKTEEDIVASTKHTDVRGIVEKLRKAEESDTEAEKQLQDVHAKLALLAPWTAWGYKLEQPRVTSNTILKTGELPAEKIAALKDAITSELPRSVVGFTNEQSDPAVCAVQVWKEDAARLEEIATGLGWTDVELPQHKGTAAQQLEELALKEKELERTKQQNHEQRVQLAVELPNLLKVATYMQWLDQKQMVREASSNTESTLTLFGWMPKNEVENLEKNLQKVSPAVAVLKVKPEEGEEPPVALANKKWIKPFESVTSLYGLPLFDEQDPTAALSPFFILYFALCLTDAGYGLVIAAIFGTVLFKTKKSIDEARLLWLLFLGGIVTFLVSIPFGGWFGFTPEQAPAIFTKQTDAGLLFKGQIWNLSHEDGILFLQNLSLFLGITHLFFGMFLAGWHKWIHGKKAAAFWQDFTSHILLGAVIFYVAAPMPDSLKSAVLWGSLALLVWGKGHGASLAARPFMGLIGLMNFGIGMVSNTLSYLRILALGLVTGAIAAAVNQVAVEMGKLFPVWIGIPVVICIFLGGHLVSIALNTLGSFIHSGRLQFIEFFSQFFEGGGREYSPFRKKLS